MAPMLAIDGKIPDSELLKLTSIKVPALQSMPCALNHRLIRMFVTSCANEGASFPELRDFIIIRKHKEACFPRRPSLFANCLMQSWLPFIGPFCLRSGFKKSFRYAILWIPTMPCIPRLCRHRPFTWVNFSKTWPCEDNSCSTQQSW